MIYVQGVDFLNLVYMYKVNDQEVEFISIDNGVVTCESRVIDGEYH